MSAARYFSRPLAGTPYTRYFVLADARTVERTQISRPDGVEVPEPAHLRFARPRVETSAPRRAQINPPLSTYKTCRRCGETKPRALFGTVSWFSTRRKSWCRPCANAYQRNRVHAAHDLA